MNKTISRILILYILVLICCYYLFFGPGLFSNYKPLKWEGIEALVPTGEARDYQHNGARIYHIKKFFFTATLSIRPQEPLQQLLRKHPKVKYHYISADSDRLYMLSTARKNFQSIYMCNLEGITITVVTSAGSVYSGFKALTKMVRHCSYNGRKLQPLEPPVPLFEFITDIIYLLGLLIPLILIYVIAAVFGRAPDEAYFRGDTIYCEEAHVQTRKSGVGLSQGVFSYLVLTQTRLMIFIRQKPVYEIRFHQQKPDIQIKRKNIIIRDGKRKYQLKPNDINRWRSCLERVNML